MKNITVRDVVHIIGQSLSLLDHRLISHGERVGYILYEMLRTQGACCGQELADRYILAVLHDIGAYKTEEIDRMVEFETEDVWNHTIYGYLFIRNFSPLFRFADAILCHHLDASRFAQVSCVNARLAQQINLADRIDILTQGCGYELDPACLESLRDTKFSGQAIDLFWDADRQSGILQNLCSGAYRSIIDAFLHTIHLEQSSVIQYLRLLVNAVDFRSESTVAHTITTVSISMALAAQMGIDQRTKRSIYYGALLHDIGKIAIPLSILEFPGRLTQGDMEIMKTHVVVSEQIIRAYVSEDICRIAARHHEKLDGSGYPRGLTGDKLTQAERIVAVSDIISALSGRRSYKESFGKDLILKILIEMRDRGEICPLATDTAIEHYDLIMKKALHNCRKPLQIYSNMKREYETLLERMQAIQ